MPQADAALATPREDDATASLRAQLAGLHAQVEALQKTRADRIFPFVAPLVTLLIAVGGWVVNESLQERTRAEIRRDILATYFATENTAAGKRLQIIDFVDRVLAADDAGLADWVAAERVVVDHALAEIDADLVELRARERALEPEPGVPPPVASTGPTVTVAEPAAPAEAGRPAARKDLDEIRKRRASLEKDSKPTGPRGEGGGDLLDGL